ncbi:type II secretion system F family protein [Devosia sp. XJ19-1]|uniref:Type II secretion system F family protein n=1 Tax=Devosia ureilytica TaxID=2952754 RepID=A0A9Q4AP02_9HYPH|nr:type II secretion system F family protein [Devosia ureilytica]MCP8883587.1 type II secretion system F family protein [Devosia ureilytica]MCP8887195.1 type II secretion system F family protein [Devosia ureilytica]
MAVIDFINAIVAGGNAEIYVMALVFLAAVTIFLAMALLLRPVFQTQSHLKRALEEEGLGDRRSLGAQAHLRRLQVQKPIEAYFRAIERSNGRTDALEQQLFRAGFYGRAAPFLFQLSRILLVAGAFFVTFSTAMALLPAAIPTPLIFGVCLVFSLGFMVIPAIALDVYANGIKEEHRRGFPDFMDMMITCADAGMSLEAAVGRVSTEFASTHKHLGVQLNILMLQLRAGKPLRDALHDLADRVGLDEAKALAVLFRQSEELGTSLVDALRVYSTEMRRQRILNAEEKANSLPVRMVLPLGLCVFPVVLMIIMLPVIIRMRGVFF